MLIYIINSCEYCHTTITDLNNSIIENIDPKFVNSIQADKGTEIFISVINEVINLILVSIDNKWNVGLSQMIKINWSALENCGDCSLFVKQLVESIRFIMEFMRSKLVKMYYGTICTKIIKQLREKLLSSLFTIKKFNENGANQLQIDFIELKNRIVELLASPSNQGSVKLVDM